MSSSGSGSDAENDQDGWDAVARDLLSSSQEDSDQAAKCEACRSESASATNEDCSAFAGHAESPQSAKSWWAELIRIHASTCVPTPMTLPDRAITVVSACSGIFAEGEALKAGWDCFLWAFGATIVTI